MQNEMIYLDYLATTPVDEPVLAAMLPYFKEAGLFANASNTMHGPGRKAAQAIATARRQVASHVEAPAETIVWTSGATEANNLAILGVARANAPVGKHIITSAIEHNSVINACRHLQEEGFEVTYLEPSPEGRIIPEKLKSALRKETILVSIMHINNEIGTVQPIAALSEVVKDHPCFFHVDCAQSIGKIKIDLSEWAVDLASFSGHKCYGPKGIGALYRHPRVTLAPILYGGGQEQGLRPGTYAVPLIVGMGAAFLLAEASLAADHSRIAALQKQLWHTLQSLGNIRKNSPEDGVPQVLNACFATEEEALLVAKQVAVSFGSACMSGEGHASHVLSAIGLTAAQARKAIRFSLGRQTTAQEIQWLCDCLTEKILALRQSHDK